MLLRPVDQEESVLAHQIPDMLDDSLDKIDRGILFALQRDARNTAMAEIADEVNSSASTVRNRLDRLEEVGVIEGYYPKIDYERAGFPLSVLFVCTAPAAKREPLAKHSTRTG